jgi:hypothetical protein
MKWIVLAIILFIAAYTFITLHFRKPGPAYQPYKDSKVRATVQRLQEAGYQRIVAAISTPAEPQRSAAALGKTIAPVKATVSGLYGELAQSFGEKPTLPDSISAVAAPSSANVLMPYSFQFTCTLPDKKYIVADTYVCLKENEIAVITNLEPISGGLLSRSRDSAVVLTLPPGTLKPGDYRVSVIGAQNSVQWTLQVH